MATTRFGDKSATRSSGNTDKWASKIPTGKWAEGGHMSNKFLPFITETSNAESIFKALVQRSKGLSSRELGIIYSALLIHGVTKIKEYVGALPANMSSNEVFTSLFTKYRQYEIPVNEFHFWGFVLSNYGPQKLKNSDNYSMKELPVMLVSLAKFAPNRLEEINFDLRPAMLLEFAEDGFDCTLDTLVTVRFSPDAKRVGFTCFVEFKAYVAFHQYSSTESVIEIMPIYLGVEPKEVTQKNYIDNFCVAPYEQPDDMPKSPEPMPKFEQKGDSDENIPFEI